jgi:hypothetical protein
MKKIIFIAGLIIIFLSNVFAANFDYDDRADFMVFRYTQDFWFVQPTADKSFFGLPFGMRGDVLVPSDYDGDGLTDVAVWRPTSGTWYVLRSRDNQLFTIQWGTVFRTPFGPIPDIPVQADYDGDGVTDFAVFRPETGVWYVLESLDGYNPEYATYFEWGVLGDVPVPADYDGDRKTDFAVWRSSENRWYIHFSATGTWKSFDFGLAGYDLLVPADYTGDGKADLAIYREGNWFIQRSEDQSVLFYYFGLSTDMPVPADYDGDEKTDIAVFRKGDWYILESKTGQPRIFHFGNADDFPVTEKPAKPSILLVP